MYFNHQYHNLYHILEKVIKKCQNLFNHNNQLKCNIKHKKYDNNKKKQLIIHDDFAYGTQDVSSTIRTKN